VYERHYTSVVVVAYTLLMAGIIFFLAIPVKVQIFLLLVSAAVFVLIMRPTAQPEYLGTGASPEGIARPRPKLSSEKPSSH
jgi:hypothetical protein